MSGVKISQLPSGTPTTAGIIPYTDVSANTTCQATISSVVGLATLAGLSDTNTTGLADNHLLVWNGSTSKWEPSTDLYYVGDDLGIGTATPSGALHVVGEAFVDNLKLDGNTLSITNATAGSRQLVLEPNGNGAIQANSSGNARGPYAVDLSRIRSSNSQVASGNYSVISGGLYNTASGPYSTISGGWANRAVDQRAVVGGGSDNLACSYGSVGGGSNNCATGQFSVAGGGSTNCAIGTSSTISGGCGSSASGNYSTIGGGRCNIATLGLTTISGGRGNTASGQYAVISGGCGNGASGKNSVVGGGKGNSVSACYASIAGGCANRASGTGSTVSGGYCNCATCQKATIGGGWVNCAFGSYSTISGGYKNYTSLDYAAIGGGYCNCARASYSVVAGGRNNDVSSRYGTMAGGHCNVIQSPTNECCSRGATIGGGIGHNTTGGTVSAATGDITGTIACCNAGAYSTISGGLRNLGTGEYSTISGGYCNTSSGKYSTVSGGYCNCACGSDSVVAGGSFNSVSGCYSVINGGGYNVSTGNCSSITGYGNDDCGYANAHLIGNNLCATQANTTFTQNIIADGHLSATTKSFLINHPTKPGMKLQYGSLESPYHGVRLTGSGKIIAGVCVVKLPDYISGLVNDDVNIQLTNLRHSQLLYVDSVNVSDNQFVVKTDSWLRRDGLEFYWSFTATRKDIEPLKVEY